MTSLLDQPPASDAPAPVRRVLFVVPHLDGSMRLLADYLRHLDPAFEVILFTYEPNTRFRAEFPAEAETIIGQHGLRARHLPATFARLLRVTGRCDLVCAWAELSPSYVASLAAMMRGKPVVGWVHAHLGRIFDLGQRPLKSHERFIRFFYRRMKAVIGASQGVADDLRDRFGLANASAIVNGIDIDRIRALADAPVPASLAPVFDDAQPVIVSVAALHYQKNPHLLVEAHDRLLRDGISHRLVMIGDGPLRSEIESLIHQRGLEGSLILAGYQDNPYALIRRATCLALASRWEGYALVLAEALAVGTPPVSTDVASGPREILGDSEFGLLVPEGDVDAMVEALRTMLTDPAARARFVARADEGAQRTSILPRVRQMEQVFRQALGDQAPGRG